MPSLIRTWYSRSFHFTTFLLTPFSWLFAMIVLIRRKLYRAGILASKRFALPVIIVGNIAVGGTGKTPLVIWLANFLRSQGYHPGIVSRGYGGKNRLRPYRVKLGDFAAEVGDEAILLERHTGCPVFICHDRVAAVSALLKKSACDVVISDDGLQHYRLARDIEIAVVDGARRFGNGRLLPAGPLREPVARLREAHFVIVNEGSDKDEFSMSFQPSQFISLQQAASVNWDDFPRQRIHALAGIGHPERFFNTLRQAGFDVIPHAFPDHHPFQAGDLDFSDSFPIIMTEKDAVKCSAFADSRYWYVNITVKINNELKEKIMEKLKSLEVKNEAEADFTKRSCRVTDSGQRDSARENR